MTKLKKTPPLSKGRVVSPEPVDNPDDAHPEFSFIYIQKGYDVRDCTQEERASLLCMLADMSKRTWKELKCLGRHKGGYETIKQLKAELPEKWKDATPIAFRFAGMKPVIGIRDRRIFHIIWIGAKMNKYKH